MKSTVAILLLTLAAGGCAESHVRAGEVPSLDPFRDADVVFDEPLDVTSGPNTAVRATWCGPPTPWEVTSTGLVSMPAVNALLLELDPQLRSAAPSEGGALEITLVFGADGGVIAARIQIRDNVSPPSDATLTALLRVECGAHITPAPGGQWVLGQFLAF